MKSLKLPVAISGIFIALLSLLLLARVEPVYVKKYSNEENLVSEIQDASGNRSHLDLKSSEKEKKEKGVGLNTPSPESRENIVQKEPVPSPDLLTAANQGMLTNNQIHKNFPSEFKKAFNNDQFDDQWGYQMEQQIQQVIGSITQDKFLPVFDVECRTDQCRMTFQETEQAELQEFIHSFAIASVELFGNQGDFMFFPDINSLAGYSEIYIQRFDKELPPID